MNLRSLLQSRTGRLRVPVHVELTQSIERDEAEWPLDPKAARHLRHMAKQNHAKRSRPKPPPARRRRFAQLRSADRRSRREIERWRRD